MKFYVKDEFSGKYIRGDHRGGRYMTDKIEEAKVFPTADAAKEYIKSWGVWLRTPFVEAV